MYCTGRLAQHSTKLLHSRPYIYELILVESAAIKEAALYASPFSNLETLRKIGLPEKLIILPTVAQGSCLTMRM